MRTTGAIMLGLALCGCTRPVGVGERGTLQTVVEDEPLRGLGFEAPLVKAHAITFDLTPVRDGSAPTGPLTVKLVGINGTVEERHDRPERPVVGSLGRFTLEVSDRTNEGALEVWAGGSLLERFAVRAVVPSALIAEPSQKVVVDGTTLKLTEREARVAFTLATREGPMLAVPQLMVAELSGSTRRISLLGSDSVSLTWRDTPSPTQLSLREPDTLSLCPSRTLTLVEQSDLISAFLVTDDC